MAGRPPLSGGVDPATSTRPFSLDMLRLVVEGIAGALLLAGSLLMALTLRDRQGAILAEYGRVTLTGRPGLLPPAQFATLEIALFHGLPLFGVVAYRRQLRAEAAALRPAELAR